MVTFDRWITSHERFKPESAAIVFQPQTGTSETISYAEITNRINATFLVLTQHYKLGAGDRIAWLGFNHPEFFVVLAAAARAGILLIPLNWRLSENELVYIVSDSKPQLLFHDAQHSELATSLATQLSAPSKTDSYNCLCNFENVKAEDSLFKLRTNIKATTDSKLSAERFATIGNAQSSSTAVLLVYTSGTTGRPKGALLSQECMMTNAHMSQHMLQLNSEDRILNVLPLFHVGGINIQSLPTLVHGATLVLSQTFEAEQTLDLIKQHKISHILTVPTVLSALLNSADWKKSAFQSLRSIAIGSTDVPISLINQAENSGVPMLQVYGATETGPIAIYQRIETKESCRNIAGSIGRAGLLCDIRLVDEQDRIVKPGDVGEICVRGGNILSRYWNNPDASESSIKNGWFHTGDLALCDGEGNYWFRDRKKHVIISGGENIYPAEIERVLALLPAIDEVAVVGIEDDKWGEVPAALIVQPINAPLLDEQETKEFCSAKIARYKIPRYFLTVEQLPRSALGKVLVEEARELAKRMLTN